MKKNVIIVAGGQGTRMNASVPKQFMFINKKPILCYTIDKFRAYDTEINIVLVLPKADISYWDKLVKDYVINLHKLIIIEGGKTRFESVKNGLLAIKDIDGSVAVHDGVRPFVSIRAIQESFDSSLKYGSGVLAVDVKDSIRHCTEKGNTALVREEYKMIQTPQTFNLKLLKEAYQIAYQIFFTDDASVYEHSGHKIYLVNGDYNNIKITTPEDLVFAEAILNTENNR